MFINAGFFPLCSNSCFCSKFPRCIPKFCFYFPFWSICVASLRSFDLNSILRSLSETRHLAEKIGNQDWLPLLHRKKFSAVFKSFLEQKEVISETILFIFLKLPHKYIEVLSFFAPDVAASDCLEKTKSDSRKTTNHARHSFLFIVLEKSIECFLYARHNK